MAATTSSQQHLSPPTPVRQSTQRIASGSGTSTPGVGSGSSSVHPLARKVRDVLLAPTPSDLHATRKALDEIARLYPAVPATSPSRSSGSAAAEVPAVEVDVSRARDNLARDTERRAARAARQFSKVLGSVNDVLATLSEHIDCMQHTADDVEARLEAATTSSAYLREHAMGLQRQRTSTSAQSTLLSLFLSRFTLTPTEVEAVSSRDSSVGPALFAALDRLDEIRRDCAVLLVGREEGDKGGMRAGMDIMDATATQLDAAQVKLARWLTFEFRQPAREGAEVGSTMRQAVRRLEARPDLLRPALQVLASTRATHLSTAFHVALTQGGPPPSYLPRPIEVHAHDPQRYVGDMLAWVHQAVASEREFLAGLFGREAEDEAGERGGRRMGERRRGIESVDWTQGRSEEERRVREVLDRVMEGCGRPLKIRIEQTARSQEGCITTFKLASLVHFYRVTMDRTVGTKAALSRILGEISATSYDAFVQTLRNMAAGLQRFAEPPSSTLEPPPPLLGASATLKELLAVHQSSLSEQDLFGDSLPLGVSSAASHDNEKQQDLSTVLEKIVDPMLEMCRRMGETLMRKARNKEQAKFEVTVFLINCFNHLKSLLAPYSFTSSTQQRVDRDLAEQVKELTDSHYRHLVKESGFLPIVDAIESRTPGKIVVCFSNAAMQLSSLRLMSIDTLLASLNNANPAALAAQVAAFEKFLASPHLVSPTRLAQLTSPAVRSGVQSDALRRLSEMYAKIAREVQREDAGYGAERPLRRSAQEVQVLLGVEVVEALNQAEAGAAETL